MYFCKVCETNFINNNGQLSCSCEAKPPVSCMTIHNMEIPVFDVQAKGVNEFSITNAAEIHDNAMEWLHLTHGTCESDFRKRLVSTVPELSNGNPTILVTSCGAGNDIPYLIERFPNARFFVQDIATEMLEAAIDRNFITLANRNVEFWLGDACDLPFDSEVFDLVFHFGGINLFHDVRAGIEEMHRVAKVGGSVLFGDEGIAPYLYNAEISQVLIQNNRLYKENAPLGYIGPYVSDFKLEYLFNNCFYLVSYIKRDGHGINLDIPHKGRRGGSLRTRYYGVLEGVDPKLRGALFDRAESLGKSRVELIEELIRNEVCNA